MRSMRDRIEWIYMHGRLVLVLVSFFSLSLWFIIGGGFWAKRTKKESSKRAIDLHTHLGVTATHSSWTVLSCIYIQKSFGFLLSAIVFFYFGFFTGGFLLLFFCGFFLLLMPPFISSKID